jgi:hypothetical protein
MLYARGHNEDIIDQPKVIEKILTHLGLWPSASHTSPSRAVA